MPHNVLLVITDQQRADHVGFGGNRVLKTPNLDSLASHGMRFDRAFVANPICMPNRSTIFTGRLPSVHGTRYNGIPLDWSANTFARVLRGAGYDTAYFGKCHLQNMGNNPDILKRVLSGPETDASASPYPSGWDTWELSERHRAERIELPPDFYGFDHVDLTVEHADVVSGHYYQWLLDQGVDPTKIQGPQNALPYEAKTARQIWKTAVPEELYPTEYVTRQTVEFVQGRSGSTTPFLAVCSYPDPHHPFTPPGKYFDLYDPREIRLPDTFDDPHDRSMPHIRRMLEHRGSQRMGMQPFSPTEEQYREMAAVEYGSIAMIDAGIGRILGALEASGHRDDTIVVFTSDHGDMFGDHSLMLKASMHYEGCIRVPLVIDAPGRPGGSCGSLVSSLDLAQTVLDLTGQPEYRGMQGVSLAPLLDDPNTTVRDHVLIEEDQMFDLARIGQPLRMRTLMTQEGRLTLYRGSDDGELFDLRRDPEERSNLYAEDSGRRLRVEMTERLAGLLMEYADESPRIP